MDKFPLISRSIVGKYSLHGRAQNEMSLTLSFRWCTPSGSAIHRPLDEGKIIEDHLRTRGNFSNSEANYYNKNLVQNGSSLSHRFLKLYKNVQKCFESHKKNKKYIFLMGTFPLTSRAISEK